MTPLANRRELAWGAGILLGLPVLRLHGDYLALVTLGLKTLLEHRQRREQAAAAAREGKG